MKGPLKRFILNILHRIQVISWYHSFKNAELHTDVKDCLDIQEGTILYFVPHADDDLISGYQFYKRYSDRLKYVYFGYTGSNKSDENRIRRNHEFQRYCEVLSADYYIISSDKISELTEILYRDNVRTIVLPSLIDWHIEHRLLNYILYDFFDKTDNRFDVDILWYSVTVPICSSGKKMVPLTERDQNEKYDLFRNIYSSQGFMPTKRLIIQEMINAKGSGYYAAELFLPIEYDDWLKLVRLFIKMEENEMRIKRINELNRSINNLTKIRNKSMLLYNEFVGIIR